MAQFVVHTENVDFLSSEIGQSFHKTTIPTHTKPTSQSGEMECKLCHKLHPKSLSVIGLFFLVYLAPVEAFQNICPESENPLKINFEAPVERISEQAYVQSHPIALELIDPRDVACKSNYDDITVKQFEQLVECDLDRSDSVKCEITPKCIAYRQKYLQRMRWASLNALNDVVVKILGIELFNKFPGAKKLIFGNNTIRELSGAEIIGRATSGRFNIMNGFIVPNETRVTHPEKLHIVDRRALDYFARLQSAEEPTGLLKEKTCVRSLTQNFDEETEKKSCYEEFFNSWKDTKTLTPPDSILVAVIEETLDYIQWYFSFGRKRFTQLKVPFTGGCNAGEGRDPNSDFEKLIENLEVLKDI